ncbi:MAG: apolipoprotein N-acyltransferase [Calditrichaeota bacterium]|nr:MAG: apolipoprotein N-acyltransferase [Calditrichota bacterium]
MILSKLSSADAFKSGYFFGFFLNLFCIYWLAQVTLPGLIGAIFFLATYYAITFWLFNKVYRFNKLYGLISLPLLWVGMEFSRTVTEYAFPWSAIGYSQAYYLKIMQITSVISVHGLSFLIVLVNVLLWNLLHKKLLPERKLTSLLVSIGIFVGLISYGWITIPKYPIEGDTDVVLLQGSVPIDVKWKQGNAMHSFNLYDSLANSAADTTKTKLFVWPETSAPTYLTHNKGYESIIAQTARTSHGYHLVGALGASSDVKAQYHYNSAYLFNPDGILEERYDKLKLVPFSEHVPYQRYFPFLHRDFVEKYLDSFLKKYKVQWWSDFATGDSIKLFTYDEKYFSVLICFESTFPDFVRQTVLKGSQFVVGITNDTWFGESVGIYMHSRIFLTRCIENRIWGVRVANSGLTYVCDGYGRIRADLQPYEVAALQSKVNLLDEKSVFTRYGDIIGNISFLFTLSLLGIFILIWIKEKIFRS